MAGEGINIFYCPYCGFTKETHKDSIEECFCYGCMKPRKYCKSKYDIATYIEMVEERCDNKYPLESHSRYPEIIFETEISVNPLFNPELHEKAKQAKKRISDARMERMTEANKPKCPTCQSTNIKKISTLSRSASVFAFGLGSSKLGKTFECCNCGYKW